MKNGKSRTGVKWILFMIFLIGIGLNAFVIIDAEYLNWLLAPKGQSLGITKEFVEKARKSILLVISYDCKSKQCATGTGFIVKPGYIATNAHVLRCGAKCKKFSLVDYRGIKHEATLVAISTKDKSVEDLAILKMSDTSLPALLLADSAEYEAGHDGDEVVTVGYPLVGVASTPDKASVSGKGTINMFKPDDRMFITGNMNLNAGNSGGPVFLLSNQQVLGLAVMVLRGNINPGSAPVEGVDYVIPVNSFKNFFLEKTGQRLQ